MVINSNVIIYMLTQISKYSGEPICSFMTKWNLFYFLTHPVNHLDVSYENFDPLNCGHDVVIDHIRNLRGEILFQN